MKITGPPHLSLTRLKQYLAAAAIALAAFPVAPAAQLPAPPLIPGVGSLEWGISRQGVLQELGFPVGWQSTDSTVALTYELDISGEPTLATFFIRRPGGLVAVHYLVTLDDPGRCEEVFESLEAYLSDRYRGVTPVLERTDPGSLDPCELAQVRGASTGPSWKTPAAVVGGSNRRVRWQDPNSAASVDLLLSDRGIEVRYESGD